MGRKLVGPFTVSEGVKVTSVKYVEFLTDHFLSWYKKKNRAFHNKIIFTCDNAPSHAARNTSASLAAIGIKEEKLMVWPPFSLTSTLLRTFGASSTKTSMRAGGSSHLNSKSGRLF